LDAGNTLGELGRLALAALVGGLVGHYLTLSREGASRKRERGEELARAWLHERQKLSCYVGGPAAFDVEQYARALGPLQRARFRKELKRYEAAKQGKRENELGEQSYADPAELGRCIDQLVRRVTR
jgi:hypothetical protein